MASTLTLDASDPAIADMINQWEAGGVYTISLTVQQGATNGNETQFAVQEVTDYGEMEESPPAEEPLGKRPAPEAVMILVGQKRGKNVKRGAPQS